jgi:HAE1 family hydrophobic/amphiphilic exporter-1
MSIPGGSTKRPVAVWMLFLGIILLGGISYARLPIDLLPDVSYPRLVIYTSSASSRSASRGRRRPLPAWNG